MKQQSGNNTEHSILSASGAHRWSVCPASAFVATQIERKPSGFAAREGTGLHSLVERALLNDYEASHFTTVPIPSAEDEAIITEEPITEEQREAVQTVLDYARNLGGELYAEQRVYYGDVLGVPNDIAFGTGDITILENQLDKTTLHIADAKFGRGAVLAERNEQLMLYAIGMLNVFELAENIDEVKLHIIQPRLSAWGDSWTTTPDELRAEIEKLKKPARRVFELVQDKGESLKDEDFCPSSDGCNFCPVAPCRYQTKAAEEAVIEMFKLSELGEQVPKVSADDMTPDELGRAMELANLLEPFFETVREVVKSDLNAGKPVSGFKLVSLRAGSKSWKNEEDAADALMDVLELDSNEVDKIYAPRKLRTPASILSDLKNKRGDTKEVKEIKAMRTAALAELITHGAVVCTVVPVSDPREEYRPEPAVTADDFGELA